ncbi:hypothetical protein Q8F55_001062 [Vanrija albida]|uniref:Pali-domain-containing protein n=1 Tax=Vanrija albida TaxID=181172 RepID=A0ABR3QF18_9TREE
MSFGSALPGCLLLLGACVVLALVSFNTPLLKTFYFLEAQFANGDYAGRLRLGTLGYCLVQNGGAEVCQGPQVGYNFDLNTILNVKLFNIPSVISKALTYTLILHPIALAFAVIALICGLIDMIPGFSVLCFPTCFASIAGGIALIAFIFDLAIFFIAKSRISSVDGASASVGAAVWMTLAGWLLCGFAGCAWGMAGCCCCGGGGRRDNNKRRRRDKEMDDYNRDTDMRLQALRDDQRRQKEQDLPNFQPYERVPLKEDQYEDKYLYDDGSHGSAGPKLRRDGSVLQGVGVGYGRRQGAGQNGYGPNDYGYGQQGLAPQRQPSTGSSFMTAGAAGVGAGGAGVDQPGQRGAHDYNQNQGGYEEFNDPNYNYNQGQGAHGEYYNDPYGQQQQQHNYNQQGYNDQYGNAAYPPQAGASQGGHEYYGGAAAVGARTAPSADSHGYHDPGPVVNPADPYHHAYEDDGLGGIGRAATSPGQEREYTGHQGFGYTTAQQQAVSPVSPIQVPTPQHLVNPQQPSLLNRQHSVSSEYSQGQEHVVSPTGYGTYAGNGYPAVPPPVQMPTAHEVDEAPRPPSYGQVASGYQAPPEKSRSAVRQ